LFLFSQIEESDFKGIIKKKYIFFLFIPSNSFKGLKTTFCKFERKKKLNWKTKTKITPIKNIKL